MTNDEPIDMRQMMFSGASTDTGTDESNSNSPVAFDAEIARSKDDPEYGAGVPQSPAEARYRYTEHPDRFVFFAEDFLGLVLAETQKRILKAIGRHERVIIVSGNGVGKSYSVGAAILGYLFSNPDSFVIGTSGSYSQFVDGMWRSMIVEMFEPMQQRFNAPGSTSWGNQPSLEITKNWYAKIVSPTKPKGLEGRHGSHGMVVIEEADDPDITIDHIRSARSTVTSKHDRSVIVANPPEDETDIVASLLDNPKWHTIQFSSFESHNALVDAGELDADPIPGLVDLHTIREDWEDFNGESWPGWSEARIAHEERSDLSEDWYRRRAGVIPKDDAIFHKPFHVSAVRDALQRVSPPKEQWGKPVAVSVDVARKGGDKTVVCKLYDQLATFTSWEHTDHVENQERVSAILNDLNAQPYVVVDAIGEGSMLADVLRDDWGAVRYKSSMKARDEDEYYNCWTEGLFHLGQWLDQISLQHIGTRARQDLLTTAREVRFEEYHQRSGDVLKATPKIKIKQRLNRSPDHLDAMLMACWVVDSGGRRLPLSF